MPWKVERDPDGCSDEKPWSVKKTEDDEVVGCHETEDAAKAQLAALNANEPTRSRPKTGEVETRRFEVSTEGRKIHGIVPYGVESRDMGGWKEIIDPGALRQANLDELVARVDHAGVPIGRFPKTLELEERSDGLHWSVIPPESRADLREAIERGDLRAGSWQMVVAKDRWSGETRHVEQIAELRDVSVVSAPAYPAAAVEYRSAPNKNTEEEPTVSEERSTEERDTSSEKKETEERGDVTFPNHAGGLRVEDRVGGPTMISLAEAFRSRGLPAETATISWGEFRTATFGGTIDNLSPIRRDGVALGYDQRWAYPAFPSVGVGADVTSVQVFRQDSRTIPAGSLITRPIGGTTTKPEVTTAGTVTTYSLQQVAAIESNIPNLYLEQSGFESLIETDLRLAISEGYDDLVMTGIATSGFSPPTGVLLQNIRNAAGTIANSGYNPDTVLLTPQQMTDLDLLTTTGAPGTATQDYLFVPDSGPRTLWGMNVRVTTSGTAAVVADSRALGKLYASPLTLARFEVDAGATNRSNVRLEGERGVRCRADGGSDPDRLFVMARKASKPKKATARKRAVSSERMAAPSVSPPRSRNRRLRRGRR